MNFFIHPGGLFDIYKCQRFLDLVLVISSGNQGIFKKTCVANPAKVFVSHGSCLMLEVGKSNGKNRLVGKILVRDF